MNLSGDQRAAIFLMSIGEEAATEVLRHIGPKAVQKVGTAMTSVKNVTKDQVQTVLGEFVSVVDNQTALGMGTDDYIRKVLTEALGSDKAAGVIDRILMGQNSKGLESLKWMDPRAIAEIIRLEHPQIVAIVLSYLDSDLSAEVLQLLPERIRADIVLRIATLDGIQPSALKELDAILDKNFVRNENLKQSSAFGGVKAAADIMNFMDSSVEAGLMDEVKEIDGDLGQSIQDKMFVFDNLADVDNRGVQALLREVASDTLVVALKGADEAVREKIFRNMSKRASEMLRDDLEVKGPVRLSEVEAAQKEILAVARRMAEAGEIVLGGKGAEQYV